MEYIAWPLAAIIIVALIILVFRKELSSLLSKAKNVKYGDFGLETNQDKHEVTLLPKDDKTKSGESIKRFISLFSDATIEKTKAKVDSESDVNAFPQEERYNAMYSYAQFLLILLNFERLYNSIFGSQLRLLNHINSDNTNTRENLKRFYDEAVAQYPIAFLQYTFDEYFNFLERSELIILNSDGTTFSITWLGRDLLKYLVTYGKSMDKNF